MEAAQQLISPEYAALNLQLHRERPTYGASGLKWKGQVTTLIRDLAAESVLDYGCGKALLGRALRPLVRTWRDYDPSIPDLSAAPQAADLVVCTDVLEHVEPDRLDAVLDHILALAQKAAFLVVATRPAQKTLPDGRNAHLIVQPMDWWMERIMDRFVISGEGGDEREFWVTGVPKG